MTYKAWQEEYGRLRARYAEVHRKGADPTAADAAIWVRQNTVTVGLRIKAPT